VEAAALKSGEIDTMDWAVPGSEIADWLADPEIIMGEYSEFGWYELALNVQMWPLGHGSMRPEQGAEGGAAPPPEANWAFPSSWDEGHRYIDYNCQRDLDAREFRRAIAHLIDRNAYRSQSGGTAAAMETFIFPAIKDWENPAAPKYAYNRDLARACLDAGGFMDYVGDSYREYCKHKELREAWAAAGRDKNNPPPDVEPIPELQIYGRVDDPIREYVARLLYDDLVFVNVKSDLYITTREVCVQHAWYSYDYSIYTDGWEWGREPDMYYECWHSSKDIYPGPAGDNTYRYHSLEYDQYAWELKTAPNSTVAKQALDQCEIILHRDVGDIPLYTMSGYVAHRKHYMHHPGEENYWDREWLGFANEKGYGFYGQFPGFSALNAHPQGFDKGGTFRQGLILDVSKFDPVDAEWFYDWLVLEKIYEPVIVFDPYNVTRYIPWLATSFQEGTWEHPTLGTCSKVTVNLNPNILWHDNVRLTPEDVGFTYWYKREALSAAERPGVLNFDHYDTKLTNPALNDTTVVLYYNVRSWLTLSWLASVSIIPKHIWESIPPTPPGSTYGSWPYDPEVEMTVIGTGPFRCRGDPDGPGPLPRKIGCVERVKGEMIYLEANPNYHRKYVWPDVCGQPPHVPGVQDSWVDLNDFMEVAKPENMFYEENPDGTWPSPYPGSWGEYCDVNKDGRISVGDLMAIGARLAEPWPPPWYYPYP